MTVVFSIILSFYCLLLLAFLFGWVRVRRQTMPNRGNSVACISIVVAVRNEEENIQSLIHDLSTIAYPLEKFEVVIVNDHSTDGTYEKAKSLITDFSNMRLFDLSDQWQGKKAALQLGIEEANFNIIATTDADCRFSKNWLQCLTPYFEEVDSKMVVGAVKLISNNSFFARLQVAEFISLTGSTAAAIGLTHPIMCNGANLAFRKDVFNEVKGYAGDFQIASGDDEFLMRKILNVYPDGIKFMNFYGAVVSSHPQRTIPDLFYQRLRWASKWKHNSDRFAQLMAVFIFVSQVAFVGLIITNFHAPDGSLSLVMGKLFLEGVFLFWVSRFLESRFDMLAFLALQILYPIYVTVIGLSSLLTSYRWKERNYK